jgi:gas vesicle protein
MTTGNILRILGAEKRRTTMDYVLPALGLFAAGAVVGGVAALLLTPKSGREVRREISEKASEIGHRLENGADDLVGELRNRLPGMRDETENNAAGRPRKIAVKTS